MAEQSQVIVIRASSLWSGGAEPKMYSNCDLVIEEGVVAAIEDEYRGRADHEIDGGGCLVVPGLVNCHTGKSRCPSRIRRKINRRSRRRGRG